MTGAEQALDVKVDIDDHLMLQASLKQYAKYSDYKALYEKVVNPIKGMEEKIDFILKEHQQHHEIVSRYDEVLAEKASKQSIWILEKRFEKYAGLADV